MKNSPLHIVLAGGGTLGHLFPGLAVAAELKRLAPDVRIAFAGSGKAAEQRHVLLAGYEYVAISCRPRPKRVFESWAFVAQNVRGLREAKQYLRTNCVHAVVGLGGYASFAMAWAAANAGIPMILLEQNAIAGRATRRLAPHASLVCVAFDSARETLQAGGPIRAIGNPIRQAGGLVEKAALPGGLRLLVLGGSQGSESLNLAVPQALARMQPDLRGWSIVHQAGEFGAAATARLYAELGLAAHVAPFIENLPRVMASCHLAISRAGGTTLAELAAARLPAVVVPYPVASDDHQRRNAQQYAAAGACRLIEGKHGPSSIEGQLVAELPELLLSDERRCRMAECMQALARPAAAWHAARMILDHAVCAQRQPLAA